MNALVILAGDIAQKKKETEAAYNAVFKRTIAFDLKDALHKDKAYMGAKAELTGLQKKLEEEFKKLDKASLPTKTLEFYHARNSSGLLYVFDGNKVVDNVSEFAESAQVLRIATLAFGNDEQGAYECKKVDNTPVFYTKVADNGTVFVLEYNAGIYVLFDNYSIERIECLQPRAATMMSFAN